MAQPYQTILQGDPPKRLYITECHVCSFKKIWKDQNAIRPENKFKTFDGYGGLIEEIYICDMCLKNNNLLN